MNTKFKINNILIAESYTNLKDEVFHLALKKEHLLFKAEQIQIELKELTDRLHKISIDFLRK